MGKRKLRNCAKCGTRHGPPTGKNCSRKKEVLLKGQPVEEDGQSAKSSAVENGGDVSSQRFYDDQDRCDHEASASGAAGMGGKEIFQPGAFLDYAERHEEESWGAAGADAPRPNHYDFEQAAHGRRERRAVPPTPPPLVPTNTFEESMTERMTTMENMMGRVAGIQQCQLERLMHLTNQGASCEVSKVAKPEKAAKEDGRDDSTDSVGTDDDDYEWREYHGAEIWRKEKELKRRNPFDHKGYLAKGEKVDTIEHLMSVTFKTVTQLLDLKLDVRGVARHGKFMADKASKKVYHLDAFTGYDQAVRERAAHAGPAAFDKVEQEEIFTNFCYDNTLRARQQTKSPAKATRAKSDKVCLRFNDAGCSSKSCSYIHKCL